VGRVSTQIAERTVDARAADLRGVARDVLRRAPRAPAIVASLDASRWRDLLRLMSPALHPFLASALDAGGSLDKVPPAERRTLIDARQGALVMELKRREVLSRTLAALGDARIEPVLLKGAALAHTLYAAPHLRPMADLDLWIQEADVDGAIDALLRAEFHVAEGAMHDGRVSARLTERGLRDRRSGVRVELHPTIQSLEGLSASWHQRCLARTTTVRLGAADARIMCPDDALVHACLHVARSNRFANSQLSLLDIALMLDRYADRIDWVSFAEVCAAERITASVAVALSTAAELWEAVIPAQYSTAVGPIPRLAEMQQLAIEQVWAHSPTLPYALERILREPSIVARTRMLLKRGLEASPFAPRDRHGCAHGVRQFLAWTANDIRIKVPRYVRAWRRGDLASSELRRRARLAKARGRLGALAAEADRRTDLARPRTWWPPDAAPSPSARIPPSDVVAGLLKKTDTVIESELRGTSMGGTLPNGSRLRLHFDEQPPLDVGDVIAFSAGTGVTVHRIVARGVFGPARSFVLTRGDGSLLVDHPVRATDVLAVVREWKRGDAWERQVAGWTILGPVLMALHVQPRLALALTAAGFTTRAVVHKLRAVVG